RAPGHDTAAGGRRVGVRRQDGPGQEGGREQVNAVADAGRSADRVEDGISSAARAPTPDRGRHLGEGDARRARLRCHRADDPERVERWAAIVTGGGRHDANPLGPFTEPYVEACRAARLRRWPERLGQGALRLERGDFYAWRETLPRPALGPLHVSLL